MNGKIMKKIIIFAFLVCILIYGFYYHEFRQRNAFYFAYRSDPTSFNKTRKGLIKSIDNSGDMQREILKDNGVDFEVLHGGRGVKFISVSDSQNYITFSNSDSSYNIGNNNSKDVYMSGLKPNSKELKIKKKGMKMYFKVIKELYEKWELR
ncbi:hypothetical protein [Companilactobacillus sp. DQM5]|uniref:hypothetical protein n=1 Tax=Companilactobacillus sp. DQM5 TaxID=3463359 RepID=UPI0040586866